MTTITTPPKRDTAMLPAYGQPIIAFTDDSGLWSMDYQNWVALLRRSLWSSVVRSTLSLTTIT